MGMDRSVTGGPADAMDLVRRYFEAFGRNDIDGMLACLEDDVIHDVSQGTRRTGRASFAEFCRHMANCYREDLEDVVIMATSDGTRASAEFCVSGICRATDGGLPPARGQVYRLPAGTFFAVRNGRICRVSTYYNLADWLTQVRDGESR